MTVFQPSIIRLASDIEMSEIEDQERMFLILPRHLNKPVGILMSEFVDVIDTKVTLDTTSYAAEGLLGTAIINEGMTLFH